jgi:ribosomal protein L29
MALLRMSDVTKMSDKDRAEKLKELKLELIKANVTANKPKAKTKEIKKAISRINTFNASRNGGVEKTN